MYTASNQLWYRYKCNYRYSNEEFTKAYLLLKNSCYRHMFCGGKEVCMRCLDDSGRATLM